MAALGQQIVITLSMHRTVGVQEGGTMGHVATGTSRCVRVETPDCGVPGRPQGTFLDS